MFNVSNLTAMAQAAFELHQNYKLILSYWNNNSNV